MTTRLYLCLIAAFLLAWPCVGQTIITNLSQDKSVAGQVVQIAPGTYSTAWLPHAGVTYIGVGYPVVAGNITVNGSNTVLSGIVCSPPSAGGYAAVTINGSYVTLTNCPVVKYGAVASDQATMYNLNGNFDTVENCFIRDQNDIDVFHIWGHDQLISGVTVSNVNEVNYAANHTDFVQTWGSSTYNVRIARCLVENSTLQLGNTEQDINGGTWGWTFENCIFRNIDNTYFSGIPNTKFYNCVFDNVGKNQGTPIYWYAMTATGNQRDSTGGAVMNTVFYNCSGMAGNGVNVASVVSQAYNYSGAAPGFVSESAGNYQLLSTSPLVGKGTNLSSIFTTDITGALRAYQWDIGAFAYTIIYTNTPPTDTNVYVTNMDIGFRHVWGGVSTFGFPAHWKDNGLRMTNIDSIGITGTNTPPFSTWSNLTNTPAWTNTTILTNPPQINIIKSAPRPPSVPQ
jgi:hypothetical protein